jgi:hypothetical protein
MGILDVARLKPEYQKAKKKGVLEVGKLKPKIKSALQKGKAKKSTAQKPARAQRAPRRLARPKLSRRRRR